MSKPRPPYLLPQTTRHGKIVWYFRIFPGPRIRIKGEYGSPPFMEAYHAAYAGTPRRDAVKESSRGTLRWLIKLYKESSAWTDEISQATRKQRGCILKIVEDRAGGEKARAITAATIKAGMQKRKPNPARHYLDTMAGLFGWAVQAGHLVTDPTFGIKAPKRPKTRGFAPWTEDELTAYEKRWPLGTRERVWLDVPLYTGLRKGDAVTLGRQHVKDGVAHLRTEKSQHQVAVDLPILPVLQRTLDAGPVGDLTFICGARGNALTKESFGNEFRDACRKAGVNKSAHGLRKVAAMRCAETGASIPEMNAIFGWTGAKMALHYIEEASRKTMAANKMHALAGTKDAHSKPSPMGKVRVSAPKA
jgi:integrase